MLAERHLPSRVLKAAFLALGVPPILVISIGIYLLAHAPWLGLEYRTQDGHWVIGDVVPDGPFADADIATGAPAASLDGARLVGVGSVPLDRFSLVHHPDNIADAEELAVWRRHKAALAAEVRIDEPLTLHLAQGEQILTARVTPIAMPAGELLQRVGPIVGASLLWLFIGLSVVLQRPGQAPARILFLLSTLMAMNFTSYACYEYQELALPIDGYRFLLFVNGVGSALIPIAFLHFFLVFPSPLGFTRRRGFVPALYLLSLLVALLYYQRIVYAALYLELAGGFLGGLLVLLVRYFRTDRTSRARAQLRWVLWGCGAFVGIVVGLNVLPILFTGVGLAPDWLIPFILTTLPLSMALAISRHRLLDLQTLFDNTLIYAVTLALLGIMDLLLIGALTQLETSGLALPNYLNPILAIWLAVLFYVPVRQRITRWIKRLLRRQDYPLDEVAMQLGAALADVDEPTHLVSRTAALLRTVLPCRRQYVFVFDARRRAIADPAQDAELHGLPDLFAEFAPHDGVTSIHQLDPAPRSLPTSLVPQYDDLLLMPVHVDGRLAGGIAVADRINGRPFDRKDRRLLEMLSRLLGMVLARLLGRSRHALERQRLLGDLHDDVGAKLLSLIYRGDGETAELARAALKDLRGIVAESSRESIPLTQACDAWRAEFAQRLADTDIALDWRQTVPDDDGALSSTQHAQVTRLLREALNNALRHAAPTEIRCRIAHTAEALHCEVGNDGVDPDGAVHDGNGLKIMRRRIDEMAGRLRHERDATRRRFRVSWEIPLSPDPG